MDWSGSKDVEVILGKVSGVPLVRGSRVPADAVLDSFLLGESVDEIACSYTLDSSLVQSVWRFAIAQTIQVAA